MPRLLPLFLALLTLLCWTSPAWATERLAVLELSGDLQPKERAILADTVRGAVVEALGGRVQVMTKENMEVMLTDMGMDATCVSEGACEVETARNLGVDYVISGSVASMSGTQVVSLKLLETRTGQMLGSKQVMGADALALMQALGEPSKGLVGALGGAATSAVAADPAQTPAGAFEGLEVRGRLTSPSLGALVCIGPGSFLMGSPAAEIGRGGDEAQHRVTLTKGYCVMRHEVTLAQWTALGQKNPGFEKCGSDCPVVGVTWQAAVVFANAVSTSEGLTAAYSIHGDSVALVAGATGYRLPTEAEWEAAARGRQTSLYSGSDVSGTVGWIKTDPYRATTHAVCGKQVNGYDLCDMTGNAREWTGDWYSDSYPDGLIDPMGVGSGTDHVSRGGGFLNDEGYARVACRRDSPESVILKSTVGFRLVRPAP